MTSVWDEAQLGMLGAALDVMAASEVRRAVPALSGRAAVEAVRGSSPWRFADGRLGRTVTGSGESAGLCLPLRADVRVAGESGRYAVVQSTPVVGDRAGVLAHCFPDGGGSVRLIGVAPAEAARRLREAADAVERIGGAA
jgi:hypothetical protein